MVVEFVTALATGSLALLSDAGHMATDALGLGMALAAIAAANRVDPSGHRTYGLYRLEILAALANAGINIRVIDQGSSEINIIVGVETADFENAVRAIYQAFC